MYYLLKARELIEKEPQDFNISGLVHYYLEYLYENHSRFEKATEHFLKAEYFFRKEKNERNLAMSRFMLGICYNMLNQNSMALEKYDECLSYASQKDEKLFMYEIYNGIGICYKDMENYDMAIRYFREIMKDSLHIDVNYPPAMALYTIYEKLQQKDSSAYYLKESEKILESNPNYYYKARYYLSKGNYEEKSGNYPEAMDYYKTFFTYWNFFHSIFHQNSLLQVEKKHVLNIYESRYQWINTRKQLFIYFSILLSLICSFIFFQLFKNTQKIKANLYEKENIQKAYEKTRIESHFINLRLKELMKDKFEMTKKVSVIESTLPEEEKKGIRRIRKLIYGKDSAQFSWEQLYNQLSELYDNFPEKLQRTFPYLTENEIQFCYLLKAEYDTHEIAFLLDILPTSVRMKKTNLRKKLDIIGKKEIIEYIDEQIINKENTNIQS